jgi:hypothetical protein
MAAAFLLAGCVDDSPPRLLEHPPPSPMPFPPADGTTAGSGPHAAANPAAPPQGPVGGM